MKILYGVQGTGHGHISRARELLPEISQYATVDVLVSGTAGKPEIGNPITYQKRGISLSYDRNGGVSMLDTLRDLRPIRFISDVQSMSVMDYDLVISDYEPITAWAAKVNGLPSFALSHQAAFLSSQTPRPERQSALAETLLQHFAPTDKAIGIHFQPYDDFVEPPIIRSSIRELSTSKQDHITVYLPAYHHEVLCDIFTPFPHLDWHIFTPSCEETHQRNNIHIHPVSNQPFLDSFASCRGVICNAGFETCAEAMYLGKKLLPIPIHRQYEQQCNIAALAPMGIMSLPSLVGETEQIWKWLDNQAAVRIRNVADPAALATKILRMASDEQQPAVTETQSMVQRLC